MMWIHLKVCKHMVRDMVASKFWHMNWNSVVHLETCLYLDGSPKTWGSLFMPRIGVSKHRNHKENFAVNNQQLSWFIIWRIWACVPLGCVALPPLRDHFFLSIIICSAFHIFTSYSTETSTSDACPSPPLNHVRARFSLLLNNLCSILIPSWRWA